MKETIFANVLDGSIGTIEDHMSWTPEDEWVEDFDSVKEYFDHLIADGYLI